jgi:hypothetical protein
MIRILFLFLVLALLIHFGITMWRKMGSKEQWSLLKTASYSIIVSSLAVMVMAAFVILF